MARGVCKVTVHKSHGAANAEYIGRPMAAPSRPVPVEREGRNSASGQIPFEVLREGEVRAFGWSHEQDDDPVWTWNAPREITGDTYGNRENFQEVTLSNTVTESRSKASHPGLQTEDPDRRKFPVEEKRERGIAYFSALADLEERRGGVSHFRMILTVGPEVNNRQLKLMVNGFLGENFPLAEAFIAVHRDTLHTHAHVYVHSRQLDNKRVHLGQKFFRLDESWMKICSEHLHDQEIYEKHMELKGITLAWKERARRAREKGESLPPKDDRWGDHHDTKLSFRPWDDGWCGRLMAQARVAELKVEYLTATKARKKEIATASREAEELRVRLEGVAKKRRTEGRSESKRQMPAEIITVSEARDLAIYRHAMQEKTQETQPRPIAPAASSPLKQAQSENPGLAQEVLRFENVQDRPEEQSRPTRENAEGSKDKPALQAEPITAGEASAKALPDEEVRSLLVNLELARARAIALRAEEQDFKAMSHMWLSPTQGIPLAHIEKQMVKRLAQSRGVDDLTPLKTKVQLELAEERVSLPHRRAESETEVKALTERLEREKQTRKAAGLTMPAGRFDEEAIRELIGHAESASDTQLLGRVYEIERAQGLEQTLSTGDSISVRHLEEKYAGLKLEALVNQHRGESSLAWAQQHPTKIMLPAKDNSGRDIATSLDAWQPSKGIKGALRKITESRKHREFREKLEATKDSYLRYRSQRVEGQAAYCEALRVITNNCRELSREYGFDTPAAPALPSEKIKEIRDYSMKQPGRVCNPWLRSCARAEDLLRGGKTLTSQTKQGHDSASQEPDPAREEEIRKEIKEARAQQQRMVRVPSSIPLSQERDSNQIERNRDEPTRTRGGGRGR